MISLTLLPHTEKVAPEGSLPNYQRAEPLLYHQVRTYTALTSSPVVMNTYPTGSGKTLAALLWLLHPDQRHHNTLIIAPTNELIDQQVQETQHFIDQHGLDVRVFQADATMLKQLAPNQQLGEQLQHRTENPLPLAEQLGLPDATQRQPFVLVAGPDIFYYALYFQSGQHDQRNVFNNFIGNFHYLVIDEFHYYDSRQFVNFLFFCALWKQWGYFAYGQSLCLLSSTPSEGVHSYLDRVFGTEAWTLISPDNEPPESAAYPTTSTLTKLQLTLVADQIDTWAETHQGQIEDWQAAGLDGALISSNLARINAIHHQLRHLDPVRITGSEPQTEQQVCSLILATPTVDIGSNFGRPDKQRQSLDWLVCDACFSDELTQRIGHVGRVLGRKAIEQPSEAVVVVNDDALDELRALDGQTLPRQEWARIVTQLRSLPPKHHLTSYIHAHAITETFYPIYRIHELTPPNEPALEALYKLVRGVFAPHSEKRLKFLSTFFHAYDKRRRWLTIPSEAKQLSLTDKWNVSDLAQHYADYATWMSSRHGVERRFTSEEISPELESLLLNHPAHKKWLRDFVAAQVALTQALFNFHEAWQGPSVAFYDPQRLFSSVAINRYDLFHLVANYELHFFLNRAHFERLCGPTEAASFYVELRGLRDPKLVLSFDYQSQWDRGKFEDRHCRSVVAVHQLNLIARAGRTGGHMVQLPEHIRSVVANDWLPCLIVAEESWGPLPGRLHGTPFYAYDLQVSFPDGTNAPYKMIVGTAAFHVLPMLMNYDKMQDKQLLDEAVVV